jgi:hypothetical protein
VATEEELKRALKAFKKRLKLTRLDDESGLSRGGGKKIGDHGDQSPDRTPAGNLGRVGEGGQVEAGDVEHLFRGRRSLRIQHGPLELSHAAPG